MYTLHQQSYFFFFYIVCSFGDRQWSIPQAPLGFWLILIHLRHADFSQCHQRNAQVRASGREAVLRRPSVEPRREASAAAAPSGCPGSKCPLWSPGFLTRPPQQHRLLIHICRDGPRNSLLALFWPFQSLLIYTFEKYSLKQFVINNWIHLPLIYILLIPKGILSGKEFITFYFNDASNFMSFSYEPDIFFSSMLFVPS